MPKRLRELGAVAYIVGFLFVIAVAAVAFWLAGNAAGLIIIFLFVASFLFLAFGHDRRGAVETLTSDDAVHRILVMAHEGLGGDQLVDLLNDHQPQGKTEIYIVVPALSGRLKRLASDTADEEAAAEANLQRLLTELKAQGRTVHGTVGDSDPRMALEDVLKQFSANEVVVVNPVQEEMASLEHSSTDRALEDVALPVTVING